MRKMPSLAEFFIIAVGLVIFLSLAWSWYDKWQERTWHEGRIRSFDPNESGLLTMPSERLIRDGSLAGRWTMVAPRYGSTLVFCQTEEKNESHYQIKFATHTCRRRNRSDGTAEFHEGIVTLGRPVAESLGPVYQQLYCVDVGGKRVLLPRGKPEHTKALSNAIRKAEAQNQWDSLHAMAYLYDEAEGELGSDVPMKVK